MENERIPLKVPVERTEKSSLNGITIDESKFPSNSNNKDKEPAKVVAKASRKKKSSFLQTFFQEDAASIGVYILTDVIVPTIKELIQNVLEGSLNAAFWGKTSPGRVSRSGGKDSSSRTPYNSYYQGGRDRNPPPTHSKANRATLTFDDIVWHTRDDAESVLYYLQKRVQEFGTASVADLYEAADVGSDFTDDKYGWRDLSNASVLRIRNGYILDLPRAELLV